MVGLPDGGEKILRICVTVWWTKLATRQLFTAR